MKDNYYANQSTILHSTLEYEEGFSVGMKLKDRYLLVKRLGIAESGTPVGAFGLVYLAEDLVENNRKVVVKILKERWLNQSYIVKHFFQETEAINRIHGEGVVHGVINVKESKAEENGRPFFVIDFAEGKTLREVLHDGPLELERCSMLVKEISYALDAIHRADVIHRDLKPENIIIEQRANQPDRIKVIDFGIALVKNSTIARSTIFGEKTPIGTPAYCSPEQIDLHETSVGEVFTLAVIAYEMLTGKMAFRTNDFKVIREFHQRGLVEKASALRPELPLAVDEVIDKGLALDPVKRYQTPIEFATALSAAIHGKPVLRVRKYEWMGVLTASVLVLLFLTTIGFALKYLGSKPLDEPATVQSAPDERVRLFSYFFNVQRVKDDLPSGPVFATTDVNSIEDKDKFELKIDIEQKGNFFLVEEINGSTRVLFPVDEASKHANPSYWTVMNRRENRVFWLIWSDGLIPSSEIDKPAKLLAGNPAAVPESIDENGKITISAIKKLVVYKLTF